MRPLSLIAGILALALTAAACTTPTAPVDTSYSVTGTAHGPADDPDYVPLAVSLFMIRESAYATSAGTASLIPIGDDFLFAPATPVGDDGRFEAVFPDADDVPATTLAPANDFVYNARSIPTCALDVSAAAASVSMTAWQIVSIPGLAVASFDGVRVAIITGTPIDFDDPDLSIADFAFQTWVFADRAVDVSSGAGCRGDALAVVVDVSLQAGWNQLEWLVTEAAAPDPTELRLRNSAVSSVHVYPAFPF